MGNVFYCRRCVLPSTRPYITFNDKGVCSACTGGVAKKRVDWKDSEEQFRKLVWLAKSNKSRYDCVIPVSGGKDSIYQVVKAKQYGMNVLAVSVDYGIKTKEGINNLNIIADKLGTDILTFKPGSYHRKLIRIGFIEYGDPDMFSHALLYSYPVHVAKDKGIPLVLFGENPATEYLGMGGFGSVDVSWFTKHVVNYDYWLHFWGNHSKPFESVLRNYYIPELAYHKVDFLGNYFYWDSNKHAEIADRFGFMKPQLVPGTYRSFVGVDETIHHVHQYMKLIKFGYGRATDHACEDLREGRITREEAVRLANTFDAGGVPNSVVLHFCSYIDISFEQYRTTVDRFRNLDFWKFDKSQKEWRLSRDFNVYLERKN